MIHFLRTFLAVVFLLPVLNAILKSFLREETKFNIRIHLFILWNVNYDNSDLLPVDATPLEDFARDMKEKEKENENNADELDLNNNKGKDNDTDSDKIAL